MCLSGPPFELDKKNSLKRNLHFFFKPIKRNDLGRKKYSRLNSFKEAAGLSVDIN